MMHLWKFSCKPNYPVISQATVIFQSLYNQTRSIEALEFGISLAKDVGIYNTNEDQSLIYLGQIETAQSLKDLWILYYVTGEY